MDDIQTPISDSELGSSIPTLPVKKDLGIVIKIIIGIVVAIIIGVGILLATRIYDPFWSPFRPNPEKVIRKALAKMEEINNLHYSVKTNVKLAEGVEVLINFNSDLDKNNPDIIKTAGDFNIIMSLDERQISIAGEYKNIGDTSFIKLNKIPNFPFLGIDFFKLPKDQWIKIKQEAANQYKLIVELAGIKDLNEAIKIIGETPFLEFRLQRSEAETQRILDKQKEIEGKTDEEMKGIENWQLAFEDPYFKPTSLTGRYLKKVSLVFSQTPGEFFISLQFNDEGSKILEELTEENAGKTLAIFIDGIPVSTLVIQEKIVGGLARIAGGFSLEEAKELVRNLNAGALPMPIKLISHQLIGPSLETISLVYEIDLSNIEKQDYDSVIQDLRNIIERRINTFGPFGPTEVVVRIQETDEWRITKKIQEQKKIMKMLRSKLKDKQFYMLKKELADEKIADIKTYHYLVNLNQEKVKEIIDLLKISEEFTNLAGTQISKEDTKKVTNEEFLKGLEELGDKPAEIWISKKDNYLYKFKLGGGDNDFIKLEVEFSNFNKPIDIQEPIDYKSLEEVLAE